MARWNPGGENFGRSLVWNSRYRTQRKSMEGEMSESDIEFFRRELKSREPSQLTLITGTGDEAQKVLRDMIDVGASVQDAKLTEKHESAVDEKKMKIEQSIRIEESVAPGRRQRNMRQSMWLQTEQHMSKDLNFVEDIKIDYAKELNKAIDTYDIRECIEETFQVANFSANRFDSIYYSKKGRAYLHETEFYCRKAREYREKEQVAAAQARSYEGLKKKVSQNIEKEYLEVFHYCIQEAMYWKLKAEIYNNCEQEKKRIQYPTESSSCYIHSENDVTKYVYIPTDRKNIDKDRLDFELAKVGVGARSGVDNVMLVVKEINCKEQDTLNMMIMLSSYGAPFKDRGTIIVTERCRVREGIRPNEYFDIMKQLGNRERIFYYNPNDSRVQTEIQEFIKQTRCLDGVRYQKELTNIGMRLYTEMESDFNQYLLNNIVKRNISLIRKWNEFLIRIISRIRDLKALQEKVDTKLKEIKIRLDEYENKEHPDYLALKRKYERLSAIKRVPFYDDDPENFLELINEAIAFEESLFSEIDGLNEGVVALFALIVGVIVVAAPLIEKAAPLIIEAAKLAKEAAPLIKKNPKTAAAVVGVGGATASGAGVGAVIGTLGGPIGTVIGGAVGGAVGGAGATVGIVAWKIKNWWNSY